MRFQRIPEKRFRVISPFRKCSPNKNVFSINNFPIHNQLISGGLFRFSSFQTFSIARVQIRSNFAVIKHKQSFFAGGDSVAGFAAFCSAVLVLMLGLETVHLLPGCLVQSLVGKCEVPKFVSPTPWGMISPRSIPILGGFTQAVMSQWYPVQGCVAAFAS